MSLPNTNSGSPAFLQCLEQLALSQQMTAFAKDRHLVQREKQHCAANRTTHGIFVIRETEEGWWRESIDFKGDVSKQIEKLRNDPTVACGWINRARFNEPGGWYDPS